MQNSFCAAAEQIRLYITILGLTFGGFSRIISYVLPGVAQLVARMVRVHEAVGSNPATRTKNPPFVCKNGGFFLFFVAKSSFIILISLLTTEIPQTVFWFDHRKGTPFHKEYPSFLFTVY